jgi:hypothetical protein
MYSYSYTLMKVEKITNSDDVYENAIHRTLQMNSE